MNEVLSESQNALIFKVMDTKESLQRKVEGLCLLKFPGDYYQDNVARTDRAIGSHLLIPHTFPPASSNWPPAGCDSPANRRPGSSGNSSSSSSDFLRLWDRTRALHPQSTIAGEGRCTRAAHGVIVLIEVMTEGKSLKICRSIVCLSGAKKPRGRRRLMGLVV